MGSAGTPPGSLSPGFELPPPLQGFGFVKAPADELGDSPEVSPFSFLDFSVLSPVDFSLELADPDFPEPLEAPAELPEPEPDFPEPLEAPAELPEPDPDFPEPLEAPAELPEPEPDFPDPLEAPAVLPEPDPDFPEPLEAPADPDFVFEESLEVFFAHPPLVRSKPHTPEDSSATRAAISALA